MDKNAMREMVDYYNYDKGVDFPDEPDADVPFRAICANVAWCLLDEERFLEYYSKSDYWRALLIGAVHHYCSGAEIERMRRYSDVSAVVVSGYIDCALQITEIIQSRFERQLGVLKVEKQSDPAVYAEDVTQMLVQMLYAEGAISYAKSAD